MDIPGKGKSRVPTTEPNSPPVSMLVLGPLVTAGYLRSLEDVKNVEHGRSMALATFTVTAACVAATLSRLHTRAAWIISIGTILSSFFLVQTPAMNRLLHLQPLHLDDWVLVGLAGLFVGGVLLLRDFLGSRIKPTTA
jgi:P-type Ca2+ transporter type 2C